MDKNTDIDKEIAMINNENSQKTDEYRDYFFLLKRAGRIYQLKAKEELRLEEIKKT